MVLRPHYPIATQRESRGPSRQDGKSSNREQLAKFRNYSNQFPVALLVVPARYVLRTQANYTVRQFKPTLELSET